MRNRFDRQLQILDEQLTHMGELCEVAIANATKALREGDAKQARAVMAADEEIDQMEKDIERLCLKLLLQQQPVAKDLRRISAALKMITDMERIGDQTSDIAEIVLSSNGYSEDELVTIGVMAGEVSKMVRDSVNAYVSKDLELAKNVIREDDAVDTCFEEVKEQMIAYIKEEQGPRGKQIFDLIMVTKYTVSYTNLGVTAIIQSSSASVGILQSLAAAGLVPFNAAVYIIMGQNIGTCVTAIMSSIGAKKNCLLYTSRCV